MQIPTRSFAFLALVALLGCRHLEVIESEAESSASIRSKYDDAYGWVRGFDGVEVGVALRPGTAEALRIGADGRAEAVGGTAEGGETILSFVQLSDAQLRDERIRLGGPKISRKLDRFAPVTEYGRDQQRYDSSVFLALAKALNGYARGFDPAADVETRRRFPLFAIHTGDAVHSGVLQELYEFLWIGRELELPWLQAIGNHDTTAFGTELLPVQVRDPRLGYFPLYDRFLFMHLHGHNASAHRKLFRPGIFVAPAQSTPHAPTADLLGKEHHGFDLDAGRGYYALTPPWVDTDLPVFDDADEWWRARMDEGFPVRFLVLDTTDGGELHKGGVDPAGEQMAWLRGELERAREDGEHTVVFGHHDLPDGFAAGGDELARLFAAQPRFLGYFCGHTHKQEMRPVRARLDGGRDRDFWQVIGPPIIEWPQSGLLARLLRLDNGGLAWELTPFTHGYRPEPGDGALDPDHPDPAARLRAQVLLGATSAFDDYHRGDPGEEIARPPVRLLVPGS